MIVGAMVVVVAGFVWLHVLTPPSPVAVAYAEQSTAKPSRRSATPRCAPTEILLKAGAASRIRSMKVTPRKLTGHFRATGKIGLPVGALHQVSPRVGGSIVRFYVAEGQMVKKGQRLALLRSVNVGRARMSYVQAHAVLQVALKRWNMTKALVRQGLGVRRQRLQARLALLDAQNKWGMARAMLQVMGVGRPKLSTSTKRVSSMFVVRATQAGRVSGFHAQVGEWATPQKPIVSVGNYSKVMVRMNIHLQDLRYVKRGHLVSLNCALLQKSIQSPILGVAPNMAGASQTVEAWALIDNPKGCLRVGQFVEAFVHTTAKEHSRRLAIPENTIQRLGSQRIVFVLGSAKDRYQVRPVVTGRTVNGWTTILYGLSAGERVVTSGAFFLKSELLRDQIEGE